MIKYGCHSENFGNQAPEKIFEFIHMLGFDNIDVSARTLITQKQIVENPEQSARFIKELGQNYKLTLDELFLSSLTIDEKNYTAVMETSINNDKFEQHFHKICQFAREAGFRSIMGAVGGIENDSHTGDDINGKFKEKAFANAIIVLNKQVQIASEYGLVFSVEPNRHSILSEPEKALLMAKSVPNLNYTLDILHFHTNGHGLEDTMKLLPYTKHFHIRQAKKGIGKCNVSEGEINYDEVVKQLVKEQWSGSMAMEFWCGENEYKAGINAVEQNIVMRYTIKELFKKYL
jgi:Xylose isomerase-like TIM barrel.